MDGQGPQEKKQKIDPEVMEYDDTGMDVEAREWGRSGAGGGGGEFQSWPGSSEGGDNPQSGGGGDPNAVQPGGDKDVEDSLNYLNADNDALDNISLDVTPCSQQVIRRLFNAKSVYEMSSPIRGRCLIINNRVFRGTMKMREGSVKDVNNVKNLFEKLKFEVISHENLTSKEMLKEIKDETAHSDHAKYGMFVLFIMTHGDEIKLCGADGRTVLHRDVYDAMSPLQFKHMAGKPKLIFFQACAGERIDDKTISTNDPYGHDHSAMIESGGDVTEDYLSTDDMFIMKASFLSFVSIRHKRQGSWFIRALVVALYKHACHLDIETIFKQVKDIVRRKSIAAHKSGDCAGGQQPTYEAFPRDKKQLYLFPGYNPEHTI